MNATKDAVARLFEAFGVDRTQSPRVRLYTETLRDARCEACVVAAIEAAIRHSRKLPSLSEIFEDASALLNSESHTPHILAPQLPATGETFWHQTATKIIRPRVDSDDEALFLAAEMWFMDIPADADLVSSEVADPQVLSIWRSRHAGRPITGDRVARAFERARRNAAQPVVEWSDVEWAEWADV